MSTLTHSFLGLLLVVAQVDAPAEKPSVFELPRLQARFQKQWRDDYLYAESGELLGWTRTRGDDKQRFTFDGCLVTKSDDQDRPLEAKVVRYVAKQQPGQTGVLEQVETEEIAKYEYGSESLIGKRTSVTKRSPANASGRHCKAIRDFR